MNKYLVQSQACRVCCRRIGNEFSEASRVTYLYALDSKVIMHDSVVHTIRHAKGIDKAHQSLPEIN